MATMGMLTAIAIVAVRVRPEEELDFFGGGGVVVAEGVMVGASVLCDRIEVEVEVTVTMSIFLDDVEVDVEDVDEAGTQLCTKSGNLASTLQGISGWRVYEFEFKCHRRERLDVQDLRNTNCSCSL